MREYAREHLAQSGEEQDARRLHRDYFREIAEEVARRQSEVECLDGLGSLETDLDNLRAALTWSLEEEPEVGLRLALSLRFLWKWRSRLAEGSAWIEQFLVRPPGPTEAPRRAAYNTLGMLSEWQGNLDAAAGWYRQALALAGSPEGGVDAAFALCGLGTLSYQQTEYPLAVTYLEESADLYQAAGRTRDSLRARTVLGAVYHRWGHDEQARAILEECLALARRIGDHRNAAEALDGLGDVALDGGDPLAAQDFFTEKLAAARACGVHELVVHALSDLGRVARLKEDQETATARVEEALDVARHVGSPVLQTFCLNRLARLAYDARDLERLGALGAESLDLSWRAQEISRVIPALHRLAALAAGLEDPVRAVRLLATADRLEEAYGPVHLLDEREFRAEILALARNALDEAAFLAAWTQGAASPVEQVVRGVLRWSRLLSRASVPTALRAASSPGV